MEKREVIDECVIVPTYKRNHFLWACLRRIRVQDQDVPIIVFSDRGEDNEELRHVCKTFEADLKIMPIHDYYGNSFCVMEALRWAYEEEMWGGRWLNLIHVCEDDFMQTQDCLAWHRKVNDLFSDLFCSCGWVFNRQAPISDDLAFAPWFYAPNYAITREKLAQVVKHANPLYYNDMAKYVLKVFPDSILHAKGMQENTQFWEQDALFQYCIEADKSQVAWNGIAKGSHVGASGYNRPTGPKFEGSLQERVAQVEGLIEDHYWRAELFTREVVEREIGHPLRKREFKYRVTVPGGWSSEFVSELSKDRLPKRINSVPLGADAVIELAE